MMFHRIALRVSLACFVLTILIGGLALTKALMTDGERGFGLYLWTVFACGAAFSASFIMAMIAAWRIKAAWWLVLAHVPFLLAVTSALFG
jgi:hypothetical protein